MPAPVPTSAPTKPYLRRGEVLAWIEELGIEERIFDKLVDARTIERIQLTPGGRGYYLRAAVELHIIEPFRAAEARLSK